jgi:hypothetical protein
MIHQRITTTIALTLTLVAITTPAAVASSTASPVVRPNPDKQTASSPPPITQASCGDLCSGHGYGPMNVTTPAPATAASCGDLCSGHGYGSVNVAPRAVPSVRPPVAPAPSVDFHWGDAGIGAGGMLALTLIGLGGAVTLTHRRRIHDEHAS